MTEEVWALVLTAAVAHAMWNVAARKVAGDTVVLWLSLSLGALIMLPICAYVWWQDAPPMLSWPGGLCMLATGVFHGLYFALLARAYEHGEISMVYPVARGSGVGLTAFLAWLGLREEISLVGAAAIGLIIAGILTLGAPALRREPRGLKLALGVGLTTVCYSLVDKIGVGYMQPIYYITGMWSIAALLQTPFVLRQQGTTLTARLRRFWPQIILIGLGAVGTYLLILYAYTEAPVSYVIAARESSVLIGVALGIIFLKERLTWFKTIGVIAIVGGLVLIRVG